MYYSKEYVDALCARADIVAVIRGFMKLRRDRGYGQKRYRSLCPFHPERTPSFLVSPTRQTYHCFGCGAHGGVIKFLEEHQRMDYHRAIQWLAKRYRFHPKQWDAWKKKRAKEDRGHEERRKGEEK